MLTVISGSVDADVFLPEDYPPPGLGDPLPLRNIDDYFGPVERHGNVLTTSTEWPLDTYVEGDINLAIRQVLTETIIENQGDRFDFVMVLTTFPVELRLEELAANGMYWSIRNAVEGIGLPMFDHTADWGSSGRLQGFIDLGQASAQRLFPQSNEYQYLLSTVMHEVMHRWSSYVRYTDGGTIKSDLLGHLDSHWNSLLHTQASVMYGHDWIEQGESAYLSGPVKRRYSDLDMYLAGLADSSEVSPMLRLRNPQSAVPEFPESGLIVEADYEFIPIESVVEAEGPRVPDVVESQKHFRAALVLVTRPEEEVPPGLLASVERLRRDVQSRFSSLVGGRAILHIVPEALASAEPGAPEVLGGSSPSETPSVDVELALDWLEQARGEQGIWSDRNGSRWRDTASALSALRLLRPDSNTLSAAETALNEAAPETLEALAWRARALPGNSGKGPELIDELVSLQRADGGWGLTDQHQSSVEDTSGILMAFWDVLPEDSSSAALEFIASTRNAGGGWGSYPGASTHFPPTLSAIEALSLPISSHSEALDGGRDWLASCHRPSGEFRHTGETFSPGDTARALALLIGQDVDPSLFDTTALWLSRRQGENGDWSGSAYSTAEVLLVLGLLELPNLQVTGQPSAEPEAPVAGSMVRLAARIANTGREAAPESVAQWHLGDPRSGGVALSGPIQVSELTAGSSQLVEYVWDTASLEGEQDVWIAVDGGAGLEEWTLEDNYGHLPLYLSEPPEGPELALHPDAVSVSPAAVDSVPSDVQVTGTLWNHGNTTVSDVPLALIDTGAIPPTVLAEVFLDVSAGGQVAFDLSFQYDGSQSSQLLLVADPAGLIADADRSNNEVEIGLSVSTGIDVAVESIALEPEESPYAGHPLKIVVELANRGLAAAPSFAVQVEVVDSDGQPVHQATASLSMDSLSSTTREFDWQPAIPGTYTVSVHADPDESLDDVDPLNNELESPVEVTAAQGINLRLDPLSVVALPDPGLEGDAFNVTATVHSDGGESVPAFSLGLFDGDPREGGQFIGDVRYDSGLAPGESLDLSVQIDELSLRGQRTLWLQADSLDEVSETDELDNLHAFEHDVLSLPDLMVQVSDFSTDPAVPIPGEPVTLEARVHNLGEQSTQDVRVDLLEVSESDQTLIETRVVDELSEEGFATLSWSWTLGTQEGLEAIRLVVDPEDVISEQSPSNNQADLGIGTGDGPLFATNRYFSPNGDGIKDDTLLVFRLDEAHEVELLIERPGQIVRRINDIGDGAVERGQVLWDGRDDFGSVAVDDDYTIRLRSGNQDLATTLVTVDTDQPPLVRANRFGRIFHNQVEGFERGYEEPLPVTDPDLGPAYVVLNPYSEDLETTLNGVYKNGIRTLEPVVSDRWIQAQAELTGILFEPEEIAYDGNRRLAILAEHDDNYQIWLADLSSVDSVVVFDIPSGSVQSIRLSGFDAEGQILLHKWEGWSDGGYFAALNPDNGQFTETARIDWRPDPNEYSLLAQGVLVYGEGELAFLDLQGGIQVLDLQVSGWPSVQAAVSASGDHVAVHFMDQVEEGIFLFSQAEGTFEELRRVESYSGSGDSNIFGPDGAPIEVDTTALGMSWSPNRDLLAIANATSGEIAVVSPQLEEVSATAPASQLDYSETLTVQGEDDLSRQWQFRSVQRIATRVARPEEAQSDSCCVAPSNREESDPGGGLGLVVEESQGVRWDHSGNRLMFALSDVIVAHGAEYHTLVPGESTLYTFDHRSGELEVVHSDSLWPFEGQTGNMLVPDSSHYGFSLHLVNPFRIPRFYWWSAAQPQEWLEPLGPYFVKEYWPSEAGYSLVEDACPYSSYTPWGAECLPTPVMSLDRPTGWLSAVLALEDLDLGGFATDRNFKSWRIDLSPDDGQGAWQEVMGWTESEVIDARFLRWPPSVSGPVVLRLELEDKAGNRHQVFRRIVLPIDPQEPLIDLVGAEPRLISPNGDGVQDEVTFEYEALLSEPFLLRALDDGGNEVFSEVVSHLPDDLGMHAIQWAGQSNAGPVVADGDYEMELWRYSVPVAVDNTAPSVEVTEVLAPFLDKPPHPTHGNGYNLPAMISAEISDESIAHVSLESRLRSGSLEWSGFGSVGDWSWVRVSRNDFTSREFRIRADDSAGNITYGPVPWPGDYLMLMGAKNGKGKVFPDPSRRWAAFDPSMFNDESSDSISWRAEISLTEADSLQLNVLDFSLDRIDDLFIDFRAAGESEWQSYQVSPDELRDGWVGLPIEQIPSPRTEVRLRSSQPDLLSNVASLGLSYIGDPTCLAANHERFFDDADIAVGSDDMLVFWRAFSSPDFQVRELRHIRPGQQPEILEPVLVGSEGARVFLIPDVGVGEETFVYQVRLHDGTDQTRSFRFGCDEAVVPMPICYDHRNHAEWFSGTVPEVDPLTHSRIFWRPYPSSEYPVADLLVESVSGDQLVEPTLTGEDGARLYLLDKSSTYRTQIEVADSSEVREREVDTNCLNHIPAVKLHSLPAQECDANAGGVRISLLPPEDPAYPGQYSHVRSELRTTGGAVLTVLFDVSDPVPSTPGESSCPRSEVLAQASVDLGELSPGIYEIVTVTTSEQGDAWQDVRTVPIYAQAPAQQIDTPQDQTLVCVSESEPVIGVNHGFLDARLAPAVVEAWGDPNMVGQAGYRLEYAETIVPDEMSFDEDAQGQCQAVVGSPVSIVDIPMLSSKVSPFELNSSPPSPQSVNGILDLNFSRIGRAGGRSCDARRVRVDSRVETVELAATPVQTWSQWQTPMLTLDGAASLREMLYRGRTHEPLSMQMLVYPAVFDGDDLVRGENPVRVFDSLDVDGPANAELSPAEFELEWNGQLDEGWAEDGFYFLVPFFQDECRQVEADAELVEVDSTPPLIQIASPQPAQTIETNLLEVVGSVSDKYFEFYEVSFGVGAAPSTWSVLAESEVEAPEIGTLALGDVSGLEGSGVIRVVAGDLLGNESELLIPVTFDTPPPLIEALSVAPPLFGPTGNGDLDSTAIGFSLAESASVSLVVADEEENPLFDLLTDETREQGAHTIEWTGEDEQDAVLPDGRYRVLVSAQAVEDPDHAGESGHDVVIDTMAPQLEFLYPDAAHIKGEGLAEISFEELHPYRLSFELLDGDDNPIDSGEIPQPSNQEQYGLIGLDDLEEGAYRLEVEAVDRARNRTEEDQAFVIDRTPPDLELETPGEGSHLMVGKVYEIAGAVDEDNLLGWQLAVAVEAEEPDWQVLHESETAPEDSGLYEWLVDLPDGDYLFRLQAVDRAGNESEIIRAIVVDGTPPQAQIATPESQVWAGPVLELTGTADDLNLGAYRISMALLDAGEVSGEWSEIAFSEQGVADGVLAEVTPTAASGSYRLHLEAWDRAGNVGESTRDFNYTSMPPPAPTGLIAQVENHQDVHLSWQAPAHAVPLAGFHVYRNGEPLTATPIQATSLIDAGLVEGSYQYTVTALDEAGNESAPSTPANVVINLTAPSVHIASPEPASRVRGLVDVTGTAHSAEGFASYQLWVQPPTGPAQLIQQSATPVLGGTLALWNTAGLQDESQVTLLLEAEDTFGNEASVSVDAIIDNLAPQAPTGLTAEVIDGENIQLDWNAGSEPDLLGYLLYRNGDAVNWSGNLPDDLRLLAIPELEFLDEVVPDGLHAYRAFAIDQAGNVSPPSDPAQAELDRRPPGLTIVEPLPGHAFDESVRVTADSEDLDIATVQFAWRAEGDAEWTNLGDAVTQRPYRRVWTPDELPWGGYEIRALASDTGGLTDPEPPVVTVQHADVVPPQIPLGLSAEVDGIGVSLTWQPVPDDDLEGYFVHQSYNTLNDDPLTEPEYVATAFLPDEEAYRKYEYRVSAVDEVGNESEDSATLEVTVFRPMLEQPYTPTPFPTTSLDGYSWVEGSTTGTVNSASDSLAIPGVDVAADESFEIHGISLFEGQNQIVLRIDDQAGNRSVPADATVRYDLPPAPPESLSVEAVDDTLHATWDEHAEADVIGYRLFLNDNAVPADGPAPAPANAVADFGNPMNALDGDPATAWGDNYYHDDFRRPYMEVEFAQPVILTAVDLQWLAGRQGIDFDILGWSGEVWSPLARIRDNQATSNFVYLPLPYRTDRMRVQIVRLADTGHDSLGLSELEMTVRPLVNETEWQSEALIDGVYTAQVIAVDEYGFESDPSESALASIGGAQPPAVPIDLTVSAPSEGSALQIEWSPGPGPAPASYRLSRALAEEGPYEVVVELEESEYLDSPLNNGVTYYYVVEALDLAGGSSGQSATASGVPTSVVAPPPPTFLYPGMIGDVVDVTDPLQSFAGIAQPGTIVELWREASFMAEAAAVSEPEATWLGDPESGAGIVSAIVSDGDWVWAHMQGPDRIFNTQDGSTLGPWPEGANRAAWDSANGDLWRFLSGPDVYQRVDRQSGATEVLDTPLETIGFASPAPDGTWAVLAGYLPEGGPYRMFRWNRHSDEAEPLEATGSGDFHADTHSWSPDSTRIAWVRSNTLRVLDLMAGTFVEFGSDILRLRPAWSPDSRYIAVVSGMSSDSVVQVFDTETGSIWEAPPSANAQAIPTWNADGSRLLFLEGTLGRSVAFPSGEVIEEMEFDPLVGAFGPVSWLRQSEILAVSEEGNRLALLRPTGWFRIDEVELDVGENEFHGFAVDGDGNASVPSDSLTVVLDDEMLPDLSISASEFTVGPPGGLPGETFVASALIRNLGSAPSPETEALMILTAPDGTGQSHLAQIPALDAGAATVVEWELGELVAEGPHEVVLEIDPLLELNEVARDNNYSERSFVVGEPGEPAFEILLASDYLAPGQPLSGELKLVNPGPSFSGYVEIQIRDNAGVVVDDLDGRTIDALPAGETWYSPITWDTQAVLAGQYELHASLYTPFDVELQQAEKAFRVQLDAQVEMTLAPQQPVVSNNETARILAGVEILHSNGVIVDSQLDLVATDAAGQELRRWERNLGTLLPGYQSRETINWPLYDVPTGTHDLRLELSGPSILRTAIGSLTVVENAGSDELAGSVMFTQAPLLLGQPPSVTWQVQAPAGAGYPALPLRLTLATLPGGTPIEAVELEIAVEAGESSSDEATFASVLNAQGDYAVTLEAWSDVDEIWLPLASHSASALDLGAPDIVITDPEAGDIVHTPIGLGAVIADSHSPIDQAEYRLGEDGPWMPLFESGLGDYVASIVELEEGEHELRVRASDTSGNMAVSPAHSFTVDDTPPEILVSGVSDGVILNEPVAPVVEASDTHLDEVTVTLDGQLFTAGTTLGDEGAHLLHVSASDLAGNVSEATLQFALDFTSPDVEFIEPEEGAVVLDGFVGAVLQTEPGATVSLVRGPFQGEKTADSEGLAVFDSVSLQLGENLLSATSLDSAGNESDPAELTIQWLPPSGVLEGNIIPDAEQFPADSQVAGIIELHNPAEEGLSDIHYRFRVWHEDVGTPLSEWYGDGDVPANSTAEFGWSFASGGWPLGELTLVLEILEGEDWVELDSHSIVLADVMSPDVVVLAPSDGQIVGADFTALAEAVDVHSSIVTVELSLGGGNWQAMLPDATWPDRYRIDLEDLPEGGLDLAVRAIDDWSNQAEVGPVDFIVDRTAPVISVKGVSDGQVGNDSVTPVVHVKDAHEWETEILLNGSPFESGTEVGEEGSYQLWTRAEDAAGNESEYEIQFEIDLTAPAIEFEHPQPGAVIATSTVLLEGVTEPGSQVHLIGPVGEVTTHANEQGEFQVPDWPLQVGLNTISGQALDPAGNQGAATELEISYLPEDALFHDRFELLGLLFRTPFIVSVQPLGAGALIGMNDWEAMQQ